MAFDTRKMLFPAQIKAKLEWKKRLRGSEGQARARAVIACVLAGGFSPLLPSKRLK